MTNHYKIENNIHPKQDLRPRLGLKTLGPAERKCVGILNCLTTRESTAFEDQALALGSEFLKFQH